MNRLSIARRTISLFLSFILIFGTITAIFQSFIGGINAQAAPDYMMDTYKSKFSSIKKDDIDLTNLNLNINGLNLTALPDSLRNVVKS